MPVTPSDYKMKITFGLPFSGRYVPPKWAISLAALQWPMNIRYSLAATDGLPREEARQELVAAARHHRSQYLWMLDDDVQCPSGTPQLFVRELDQRPEFDIIAAIVPSRCPHPEPMIFKTADMGCYWRWKLGDVFEVAEAATACMMIRMSVFDSVPEPWFRDLNTIEERVEAGTAKKGENDRGSMTDDIYFCRKASALGHRILAHGGLICKHWGRKGEVYELAPDSYPFQLNELTLSPDDVKLDEALVIPGWMIPAELKWLAERAREHKQILEIGSYCGRSTRALAENTQGRVVAVDTWEPKVLASDAIFTFRPREGEDWVWDDFRFNMLGLVNVHALRAASPGAASQIPADLKFDMIFIDADHSYESVCADIMAWRPKLAEGGLLCGHDYDVEKDGPRWEGVIQAVNELIPNVSRGPGSIWYAPPNGHK